MRTSQHSTANRYLVEENTRFDLRLIFAYFTMESEFYRFSEKIAAFVSPKNDYTEDLYSEILEKRKSVECKGLTTWSNIINVIKNHSKSPNTDRDIATFISLIQDLG